MKKRKPGLIVTKAEKRLKGMKKIDSQYKETIDYGGSRNPLSSRNFKEQIKNCKEINEEYNKALLNADEKSEKLHNAEAQLSEMYSRILPGCVSKFGSDAPELSILGGTRKSERKKSKKRK